MSNYLGSNVVVTGASRGIGLSIVDYLLREWPEVRRIFAAVRKPAEAAALKKLADGSGGRVHIIRYDAADDNLIKGAAAAVAKIVGEEGVDVLINNAGIGERSSDAVTNPSRQVINDIYNTNVAGVAMTTAAFLPLLAKAFERNGRRAKILNISSGLASRPQMARFTDGFNVHFGYPASKAALNHYTFILANTPKIRDQIVTFAVAPGWIRTDMGGPDAPYSLDDTIPELLRTLAAATAAVTGKYLNRDGTEAPM